MPRTHRLATHADLPALSVLIERAIERLQAGVLSPAQVVASRAAMGLDTQLVADRTYMVVVEQHTIVGCGGWSRRATLYGGDAAAMRDASLLDPARDAARIRAMYTDPDRARQGIGRAVLALCEEAARAAGFRKVRLMATLAGQPLYRACGYTMVEVVDSMVPGPVAVPGVIMAKAL